MNLRYLSFASLSVLVFVLLFTACDFNSDNSSHKKFGKLEFDFSHDVQMDTFMYVNAAGNPYLVSEIQYFISDVKLYSPNGDFILLDVDEDIHYVDTDIPETFVYSLLDSIPVGDYSKVSFTFGINEEKNQAMLFVNPPESFMFWPRYLGGGFHYMKLNGKWNNLEGNTKVFNFHLGIGQNYDDEGKVESFIQNYVEVVLPNSAISIKNGKSLKMSIHMKVENWFEGPNIYDFNVHGGKIMQEQEAMKLGCENAQNVFYVDMIEYENFK